MEGLPGRGDDEPDALRAEVASAEPPLVELHSCVCTTISVHLHNQNEDDYLNNIRDYMLSIQKPLCARHKWQDHLSEGVNGLRQVVEVGVFPGEVVLQGSELRVPYLFQCAVKYCAGELRVGKRR
ncbi:hypothetical protein BTVI_85993 [Pitangus sulphuratus]|nr:hypothetical protein BTVI_85993 [Pitangus sulphuratus]